MRSRKYILSFSFTLIVYFLIAGNSVNNSDGQPRTYSGKQNILQQSNFAQDIKFRHLTQENGLSHNMVICMLQDKQGFLWFGTQDGLCRYDGYKFEIFKQGSSSDFAGSAVYSLYEDRSGKIWIGTYGSGINVFDPITKKFEHYVNDARDLRSLSNDIIYSIYEDKKGTIWIGTYGGGLNEFDIRTKKFKHYRFNPRRPQSISSDIVFCILEDTRGKLWIGTDGGGLNYFDRKSQQFTHYRNHPTLPFSISNNDVMAIYEDREERIWIGTDGGGLNYFDQNTLQFTSYKNDPKNPLSISNNNVYSIFQDDDGLLWVGTYGGGMNIFDTEKKQFIRLLNDPNVSSSLSNNIVYCIMKDGSGSLWMGTDGSGLNIFDRNAKKLNYFVNDKKQKNTLSSSDVWSICESKNGIIWIGTDGGGLNAYNKNKNSFTQFKHQQNDSNSLSNDRVWCLYEDKEDNLWIGTYGGGLDQLNVQTNSWTHWTSNKRNSNSLISNNIRTIYEDSKGKMWIGTFGNGLNVFDKKNNQFTGYLRDSKNPSSISSNNIRCILEDKTGRLWIGTYGGGLNQFDYDTQKFKVFKNDPSNVNSLSNDRILCIHEDEKGILWLGTFGGGINSFNTLTGEFNSYNSKDGLPDDVVFGILEDAHHNLWLSTNKGICRFSTPVKINDMKDNTSGMEMEKMENFISDMNARGRYKPNTIASKMDTTVRGEILQIRNFTMANGFPMNEFNQGAYHKGLSGWMYFGGSNGLIIFNPNNIKENEHIPPVMITSFKVGGQEMDLDSAINYKKAIILSWREAFFSFEFTALDFVNPSKNQYSYILEGVDKNWIFPKDKNYVNYTNIQPGDYVFKVRAANNDGIWNEQGTSLQIIITPPFWRTWTFYISVVLLIFGIIYTFIKTRERRLEKEKKRLEIMVTERTKELNEKNKHITDSINYAKRIQEAILPSRQIFYETFPESFIYYNPRDIVSGDFYWFNLRFNKAIVAVADCTGHGVPGAFMSMIGSGTLNQIVNEKGISEPSLILNHMHHAVRTSLRQHEEDTESRDGMDVAVFSIDLKKNDFEFAGAYRPLYFIRDGNLQELKGNRFPVAGFHITKDRMFTNHKFKIQKGDAIYIFTDGYPDQFGENSKSKFMNKRFKTLLQSIAKLPMEEQAKVIETTHEEWKGGLSQMDDILVIGIRF